MSTLKQENLLTTLWAFILKAWSVPSLLVSAFMIGWGAEAAQYFISKGLALAVLAWFQTFPEFAVEAVIAYKQDQSLMLANLTGSLRLLVGLGWPMIFFTRAFFLRKKLAPNSWKTLLLDEEDSVGVVFLFIPLIYFGWILIHGGIFYYDAIALALIYLAYLWVLRKMPPSEEEEASDMPYIPRRVVSLSPILRNLAIFLLFAGGGALLYFSAHPFLETMMALALSLGVSQFVFIQWISPFLSEFPEKLTAFNWAKREGKASMALMNMMSSNINQWTLLVSMMIGVYCYSKGEATGFYFDHGHKIELFLTFLQAFLSCLMVVDLKLEFKEALILLLTWFVQFAVPSFREEMLFVYGALIAVYVFFILLGRKKLLLIQGLKKILSAN